MRDLKVLPEISVIVSAYNHEKWVERCVRSLSHQVGIETHEYEIIVIDDASKDNTLNVLKNLESLENLNIIKNEKNLGLPRSLNKGIRMAKGRYIVRVDSDDYVHRHFLSLMRLFLDMNRSYQAVAVDYVKVDSNEKVLSREKLGPILLLITSNPLLMIKALMERKQTQFKLDGI